MSLEKRIKGLLNVDSLRINNISTGTSVNNLGVDSSGNVVIGTSGDTDTNTFVTGGTLSGNDLILEKNNGVDVNPIDLSGLVSGKTDLTLFNSHTGDTNNPHQTSFGNLTSTAHTHTISDVINLQTELDSKLDTTTFNTYSGNVQTQIDSKLDTTTFNTYSGNVQTQLDTKISGATNLSSEGVFAQKNGLDLEFKGLTSTGGTVNITSNSNTINLEVTIPADQDKFVSGGTYNTGTQEINFVGNSVETTFDVDLTSLVSSVSGDTFSTGGTVTQSATSGSSEVTIQIVGNDGFSSYDITGLTDTFVNDFTFSSNTFTITQNDGTSFDADVDTIDLASVLSAVTFDIGTSGSISATTFNGTTFSGGTFYGDGSNLTGISNTFVTGGTLNDNTDTITFTNNTGGIFNVTGVTDNFVSGGTYNTGTKNIDFNGNSVDTTFSVDLTSLVNSVTGDTFVTGQTFSNSTYILSTTRNDGTTFNTNLSVLATDVYVVSGVYNPSTGIVTYTNSSGGTFQVSGFTTGMTDSYTTAANLNGETIEFDNNIQGSNLYNVSLSPVLSGKTDLTLFDSHTGDTNNPHQTSFSNLTSTAHTHTISDVTNLQSELDSKLNISDFNVYSGSVETQIDGKTDLTLFNSHTGDTSNPHQTSFSNLTSTAHTHTLSDITDFNTYSGSVQTQIDTKLNITDFNTYSGDVQTQLDTKIENGINSGGANELFSGKSGTDLYFRTISGGSNTTISTIDDIIKVDVSVPVDTNTFVTGFTYDDVNTFTISRNDGLGDLTSTISVLSGVTYYGDGSNLSGISTDNFYVTGGTFSSETLTLDRNDNNSVVVTGFTTGGGDNFYVTGFTYDDTNTFTISRNGGLSDLTATINTLTGLTINGVLSASTYTGITLNDLDDVTTGIPTTPDNTYQGRQIYFDVTTNQWLSTEEYATLGTVTIWGKKGTAGTISKGLPVYITGFDNDIHDVELANASTGVTMPVIGFTAEDFDDNGVYPIITFGKITGVNTTSSTTTLNPNGETWVVNDVLYMSTTTGGLTKFRPSGTNTQIQRIAKVLKVGTTDGQLFIFNTARTSGLPNLTTDYVWLGDGNDTPQEVIKTDLGVSVTGFSYDNNNTFTITDDNGGSLSATINQISGLTVNGNIEMGNSSTRQIFSTGVSEISSIQYATSGTSIQMRWDGSGDSTVLSVNNTDFITASSTKSLFGGISYGADYSANYDDRSLIDLGYFNSNDRYVTGFTYNDNNTFTLTRSSGLSDLTSTINTMSGLTINGNLDVNGETVLSSSTQNTLTIIGSGSTNPLFLVQGSTGELFSITDSLTGTLFAVNNISGLPILEVNSDDEILMGNYQAPSLNTTFKTSITSGLTELYSIPLSAYTGGFFEYTLTGNGARAGSIMSIFSGSSVNYTETTTTDIGDTSSVTFDMNVSGGTANLTVSATTGTWEIKTIVRSI